MLRGEQRDIAYEIRDVARESKDFEYQMRHAEKEEKQKLSSKLKKIKNKNRLW